MLFPTDHGELTTDERAARSHLRDPQYLTNGRPPLDHLPNPVVPEGLHPLRHGRLLDLVGIRGLEHQALERLRHPEKLVDAGAIVVPGLETGLTSLGPVRTAYRILKF